MSTPEYETIWLVSVGPEERTHLRMLRDVADPDIESPEVRDRWLAAEAWATRLIGDGAE